MVFFYIYKIKELKEVCNLKVKNIMTKNPITIELDNKVKEAKRLLSYHNIGRLLVTKNAELIGIVTDGDLVIEHDQNAELEDFVTENLITINENESIIDAAKVMAEHQISGLPVMNDNNKMVGILTVEDIIYRYLAKK